MPPILYFYFDSSDAAKRDCLGLLSSLVFQLGSRKPEDFYGYLRQQHTRELLVDRPTYESLIAILAQLMRMSGPICLIIDALDECPDYAGYNGLLELLERLCALEGDTFRLLVTSRREADIERVMSRLATHSLSFHNHDQHKADLDQYIHAQLTGRQYSRWPDGIKRQAQQALLEKANGM